MVCYNYIILFLKTFMILRLFCKEGGMWKY